MRLLSLLLLLAAQTTQPATSVLELTVSPVKAGTGQMIVALHASAATFMEDDAKPMQLRKVPVRSTEDFTIAFENLPVGSYAVAVFHDVNDNGQLDTNFVYMPTEPYGFSKDDNIIMPPDFDEASFELRPGKTAVTVKLRSASVLGR